MKPVGRVQNKCVILGAGSVGSVVGGLIAMGGKNAELIGRKAHVDAINSDGLVLETHEGENRVKSGLAAAEAPRAELGPVAMVVLAVKSFDTESALKELEPIVAPETVIVSLQNGVENEEKIARAFPGNTIIGGIISGHFELKGPGRVEWVGDGGCLAGGIFHGDQARAEEAWTLFFGGLAMQSVFVPGSDACLRIKWSKLVLNVAFNAINALTGFGPKDIVTSPEWGSMAMDAMRETFKVMRGLGFEPLDLPGYPVTMFEKLLGQAPERAQKNLAKVFSSGSSHEVKSSMRQDVLNKRPSTEIDEINGVVSRRGAQISLDTPANDAIRERFQASFR